MGFVVIQTSDTKVGVRELYLSKMGENVTSKSCMTSKIRSFIHFITMVMLDSRHNQGMNQKISAAARRKFLVMPNSTANK